ncbi:anti-sigma factor family protein [Nocardiopsis trehalosi]|uniref:anti-sigma factor family protein n=1 Tax=Nocardiopsis trehalosi TaxID=109329 RepID=UPI000A01D40E|nr:zf-HC2 domain-containing protein [Nocardiopsis trehalosi]
MDHMGERLSALVDGELGHADRDRALRHLASCESCRFEAEMLRRLKRRLHGLDAPQPSTDFMGRLAALSAAPPSADPPFGPPPPGGRPFGSMPPLGSSRPLGGGPARGAAPGGPVVAVDAREPAAPPPAPARRRRDRTPEPLSVLRPRWGRARYAVAGVSVAALALGSAFVAGGEPRDVPLVSPALEDYAVEHALTARHAALPERDDSQDADTTLHVPAEGPSEAAADPR